MLPCRLLQQGDGLGIILLFSVQESELEQGTGRSLTRGILRQQRTQLLSASGKRPSARALFAAYSCASGSRVLAG